VALRTTDLGVASHKRLVYRNVVAALKAAFDGSYDRERQLAGIKVTQTYPNKELDFPAIVVDYQPQKVVAAGVGHLEIFPDPQGNLRKWKHSRFEGSLALHIYALSTLDRDIIEDAVAELVRFGSLDDQLNRFYEVVYPSDEEMEATKDVEDAYSFGLFDQLMLDSDQLFAVGNSATIAPWSPEDVLVYAGGWTVNLHGGYYNCFPRHDWSLVRRVDIQAFEGTFDSPPVATAAFSWDSEDEGAASGSGYASSEESYTDASP